MARMHTCAHMQMHKQCAHTHRNFWRKFLEERHILDFCVSEQAIPLDENVTFYLLTEMKDLL